MAPKIDDWLDDLIGIDSDNAHTDTLAPANSSLTCITLAPSPPPTTCPFERLICANFSCISPA